MKIGRLEFNLHMWPKVRCWKCPTHGEIHVVIHACPTCHAMVEAIPWMKPSPYDRKAGKK